ncbi:acyltransferase family protein [Paracoccus spongiarum]|uniref:Acyltransferase n=1 Tax=Paracoccus spongiarum TaxID=3064387 RepID=A0ABT9JAM3_9RHOB|nr:acyltransferase [Paracoccus sp. 2205BS29-5]MDP5306151.1 acyltransferase [Paracoccus sp. 2205BS29-5]
MSDFRPAPAAAPVPPHLSAPQVVPPPLPADLPLLTAIRFFAAFWVFAFHFWSWLGLPATGIWRAAGSGARGVDLFFVLSGFVIFHVYGRRAPGRDFGFGKFMWRRFARVYPLHLAMLLIWLVMLLALTALGVALERGVTLWDVIASALLIQSWHLTDGLLLNGVAWSVSAEMTAYLAFGLLMYFRQTAPGWRFWLAALVVTGVLAHLVAVRQGYTGFMHPTWDFGALRILPAFALGALTRLAADHVGPRPASLIGVAALVGLFFAVQDKDADYVLLPLFAALILAAARLSPHLARLPGVSALVYLGEISYSTYMVHTLILLLYSNIGPRLFGFWNAVPMTLHAAIVFGIIIVASALSYHLIEQPSRRWLNRQWPPGRGAARLPEGVR